MRLENQNTAPTMLDLIASLSEDELRSVMTLLFNHISVLLPAGPHPVMTGSEWGYPELEYDTPTCMMRFLRILTIAGTAKPPGVCRAAWDQE